MTAAYAPAATLQGKALAVVEPKASRVDADARCHLRRYPNMEIVLL